jgi:hypothetical protein
MKRRIYPTFLLMIFLMSNAYSGGPATSGNYLAGDIWTPVKADPPKGIPHENDAGFFVYLPLVLNHWNPPGPLRCPVLPEARTGKALTGFPGKMVRTGLYFSLGIRFLVSDRKYSAPSLELFQISGFAVRV